MKKRLLTILLALAVLPQLAFFDFNLSKPKELNLDNIKRISRASYLIQHEYYDPARIKPREMLEEGFYELAKEVPEILPRFEGNTLHFQIASKKVDISLAGVNQFYDILFPIGQVFDLLKTEYRGDVKPEDMEYAFISGMLSVLDPHSSMLPPKAYEEFKTQTSGQYGGLGIVIGEKEDELTVIAPLEDTPAWRAGIKTDDKIVQIGDQSTANMDLSDAVDLMRGDPGTKVTLRIRSKGQEPRDVVLTREVIAIKSVESKIVKIDGKDVGVLRVKGFQEDTFSDAVKGLEKLQKESGNKLAGIVLDLRNNPGGLLDQAILIADKFLSHGDIVYTEAANESDEDIAIAKKQADDVTLPLAVLINQGSASASEIVAGALKNNDRAIVVGQKSFGKGSVQSLFSLRDGSSLKLTVAQYLTPGHVSIQAEGIVPDIHLYPSLVKKDEFDLREDRDFSESKLDSHLENTKYLKTAKPFYDMTYLMNDKTAEESQYVSKIKEEDDYSLNFAARLIVDVAVKKAPLPKTALLTTAQSFLDKEAHAQDKLIADAMKKLDLNWDAGDAKNAVPKFAYRYEFVDEAEAKLSVLKAGGKAKLRVFLRNDGVAPSHRTLAEIESYNPLIDGKELAFGYVKPGEERSASIAVTVPNEIIDFKEDAALNIYASEIGETPLKESITTVFEEKPSPQFAYSYQLFDGNGAKSVGNGDGIPQKGEKIALEVTLKNVGKGTAAKAEVNLQNALGDMVFLDKARATLGEIKNGGEAKGELMFSVRDAFDKDEFSIKLFALDMDSKTSISDTLKFDKTKDKALVPPTGQVQVIPDIVISDTSAQNGDKYRVVAKIDNATPLKDIAIFVKGKKIYYDNLQGGAAITSKEVAVTVPLEDGLNPIVIQARGDRDLISQKNVSVVYRDPTKLAQAK